MTMNKQVLASVRTIAGIVMIIVGIAGLLLPVLPGWLLIFIGIELLGIQLVFVERIKEYVKKKLAESKKTK